MPVIYKKHTTRQYVQDNPEMLFLFGDNVAGYGLGGQAKEMRGEPNAVGVPTKIMPTTAYEAYWYDAQFEAATRILAPIFQQIRLGWLIGDYNTVVIPKDGLGTGLAKLDETAPKIFKYIQQQIKQLEEVIGVE